MKNNKMNPLKTYIHAGRVWVAGLLNKQIDELIHTTPSEDKVENCSSIIRPISTIARGEIKGLIL